MSHVRWREYRVPEKLGLVKSGNCGFDLKLRDYGHNTKPL